MDRSKLKSKFEVLSDELWAKLRKKFPEKNILVEVIKVMEELGELADLTLRMNRRQRGQKMKEIIVSARAHGIRVSPHFYNTEEEIDQLIKELKPRKA